MARYATNTSVSVEKTRAEIETVLQRYGARQFAYAFDEDRCQATIQFNANDRIVRFLLPLPSRDDEEFRRTPGGRRERTPESQYKEWEQACRQRWRALLLCLKAKLEAVECGISEFENEFLANIVVTNGMTVSQHVRPAIAQAYETGKMPKQLLIGCE